MTMPNIAIGRPTFRLAAFAFRHQRNPSSPEFRVRDVTIAKELADGRADTRAISSIARPVNVASRMSRLKIPPSALTVYHQAIDLSRRSKAQAAFRPLARVRCVRDKYGRNDFGPASASLRRLVEVGVPSSTTIRRVDDHVDLFKNFKGEKVAKLDQGSPPAHRSLRARPARQHAGPVPRRIRRTPK